MFGDTETTVSNRFGDLELLGGRRVWTLQQLERSDPGLYSNLSCYRVDGSTKCQTAPKKAMGARRNKLKEGRSPASVCLSLSPDRVIEGRGW